MGQFILASRMYKGELSGGSVTVLEDTEFPDYLLKKFTLRCSVYFSDFNNHYPMIASSENNSFQFHGLGPAYHRDRGKLGFYLYTTTGKGPHGRGTGQVRSKQKLTLNEWHDTLL